ncbi:hypothetical protein HPSH417_03325 [Helicobacter pylori Shi417]|nr:hypothetical protein HPSH_03390 [Helicobacter pylori Shi470]AFH97814.1 hypothetical protein HPSH417_03325 [Helicobacter pylori Shi417]
MTKTKESGKHLDAKNTHAEVKCLNKNINTPLISYKHTSNSASVFSLT